MALWIYDKKLFMGTQSMIGTLPLLVGEDGNLEHPTQEQEEWCMTTISFEFHQGLKNSATTFQSVIRQPAMTNLIDCPARPSIGAPLMTARSSWLALSEIRTMKPKESA
jgi:hypothetical protein